MEIYQVLSTIKILVWIITIVLVWFRLTPAQDLIVGVILLLAGAFLLVWWLAYRILYFIYLTVSHKKLHIISSQCYKISFFVWIFVLINMWLIAREMRNIYILLAIAWFFASIAILVFRSLNYKFDNISEASTISSQEIK